jgi:hypothetical protein
MRNYALEERINKLQAKIDSGRFTGAERQERDSLTEKLMDLDAQIEKHKEMEKMVRSPKLTISEINNLLKFIERELDKMPKSNEERSWLQQAEQKLNKSMMKE